jgi:hypothetical protein
VLTGSGKAGTKLQLAAWQMVAIAGNPGTIFKNVLKLRKAAPFLSLPFANRSLLTGPGPLAGVRRLSEKTLRFKTPTSAKTGFGVPFGNSPMRKSRNECSYKKNVRIRGTHTFKG